MIATAIWALKWLLATAAIFYVGVAAVLFFAQRAMLYPIPQAPRLLPAEAGFPSAEEHVLDTSDGEKIIAWHVPPKDGKPVVIFLHGNGDLLIWRTPRFRDLAADGTGLVAVSFRGYGGSSGSPTEAGLLSDADAAYRFAEQRYPAERIVVWGYSLGSGPAVNLAANRKIGALVLEAPYTSTVDIAASLFWWLPVRWLMRDQFRSDEWIGHVTAPLLIMLGENDRVIAPPISEKLYVLAREPKEIVRFPNGTHDNLDAQGAVAAVQDFLRRRAI